MEKKNLIYQVNSLSHFYGDKCILEIDEFSIKLHEIIGLIGPNGSGKSTLLRLLAFLESPSKGKITYFPPQDQKKTPIRFQITLLCQEPYLLKRSVFANVSYGLKIRKDTKNLRFRVAEALQWVGLDYSGFAKRKWYELSGGEAQRVALAARLILKPSVLLLDEPTSNVDVESGQRIKEAVVRAKKEWGTTIVISSHDRNWLYDSCDRTVHLFKGRIIGSGGENIIFGPWQRLNDNLWCKALNGDQKLILKGAQKENSVALLSSNDIMIFPHALNRNTFDFKEKKCRLNGVVTGLTWERSTESVLLAASVGSLVLNVRLKNSHHLFFPRQEITLEIPVESAKWVE